MNSSVETQQTNLKFFFGSLGMAVVLLAISGFFLKAALLGGNDGITAATNACLSVMRVNGFNPITDKKGEIQVTVATSSQIEAFVYKSGVIIASCPAYTISDYCAGTGCRKPGVSFTLIAKEL